MPRKNTKDAYIHTIMSRINYMTQQLARRDPKTAHMLSLRHLDQQSASGLVKIGEYDPYLGGTYEESLFKEEPIPFGHWPDPDNPIDMVAFWESFSTSNYLLAQFNKILLPRPDLFPLYRLIRLRLMGAIYKLDPEAHDRGPDDPCGIVPSLKALTKDQLRRLARKLERALPALKAGRPQKMLWDASLADIDLVRAVKESPSKGVMQACIEVAANHTRSCEDGVDAAMRRFYRIVELFRAPE